MNRKTNMPRYTLTLIDSTNQTPPIVLTAESTRTIIRQLTKRLDPTPERRRVEGVFRQVGVSCLVMYFFRV